MKANRHSVRTRLEHVWFAVGILLFGLKGIPVTRRSLPEAPRASLKTVRRVNTHQDGETEQSIHRWQEKSEGEKPLSYPLSPSH